MTAAQAVRSGRERRVVPYQALAAIYDGLMSHVDYAAWTDNVLELLRRYHLPPPDVTFPPLLLEAACGTGTTARLLARRGYAVEGFDQSAAMLKVARRKVKGVTPRPRFRRHGFLELEARHRYDAALCLYDSVNYLMTPADFTDFLKRLRSALKPGGLFLFDICTELNSRLYFSGRTAEGTVGEWRYRRWMDYHPATRIQENRFEIQRLSRPGTVWTERHQQRIYRVEEVRAMVGAAGFEIVAETDENMRSPSHSESLRVNFLVRPWPSATFGRDGFA